MKVLWVADFGLHHSQGGAQRTNDYVINYGLEIGHKVVEFNFDSDIELLQDSYDVVVSNNLEVLHRNDKVWEFLINHENHIRYEHDSCSYLKNTKRRDLFTSTKKNIFLSTFHYDYFTDLYGDFFGERYVAIPFIDTDKFNSDYEIEKLDKGLYIGTLHPLKGTGKFVNHALINPDKKFTVCGWGSEKSEWIMKGLNNIKFMNNVNYEDMPRIMNEHKYVYYHPIQNEPFCRSIGECILCGLDLDCSNNIGAIKTLEILGTDKFKESVIGARENFWRIVCS